MAWTTTPYCVLADVKTQLGIVDAAGNDTAFINSLIVQAQAFLDEKIGYTFQQDVGGTRYYQGSDKGSMMINACQSFSSVTESIPVTSIVGSSYIVGTPLVTDITADCLLYPFNSSPGFKLIRQSFNPFCRYPGKTYTVVGTWGYPSIPSEINRAAIRLAIHYYWMRQTAYADQLMENGSIKMRYTKKIPDDVQQLIDKKRKWAFRSR